MASSKSIVYSVKIKIIHFNNILLNSFIISDNGVYFSDNPQKSHDRGVPMGG
jgi:hypothetical protein